MSKKSEWRRCVDFPNYEVSRDGQVRRAIRAGSRRALEILRPDTDYGGYPYVKLPDRNGVVRMARVHRLVAKAFLRLTDTINGMASATFASLRGRRVRRTPGGKKQTTSRFKGVSWSAEKQLWYACIDGRTHNLGRFRSEKEAACAYDRAAFDAWGEFAFLNFPLTVRRRRDAPQTDPNGDGARS